MDIKEIEKEVSVYEETIREHRRALHKIPEIGFSEHKTHQYLME